MPSQLCSHCCRHTVIRDGRAFDIGETFSGVDWATGLVAAGQFTALAAEQGPAGATAAQVAIAWCAQQSGVTTVIPGARTPDQARANAAAAALLPLPAAVLDGVVRIYDEHLRAAIHPRW